MKGNLKYFLMIFILISILIFLFVIKNFNINNNKENFFEILSDSMYPSLMVNDKIKLEKHREDLKIERGDIVVINLKVSEHYPSFKFDEKCSLPLNIIDKCYNSENVFYVKRVLGLPNEKIKIVKNKVYINGKEIKQKEIEVSDNIIKYGESFLSKINLSGGFNFYKEGNYIIADSKEYEKYSPKLLKNVKLKNNEYFLMGDNRDFSDDSRSIGVINKSDILFIKK